MKKLAIILGLGLLVWGAGLVQSHRRFAHAGNAPTSMSAPAIHFDPISLRATAPHS